MEDRKNVEGNNKNLNADKETKEKAAKDQKSCTEVHPDHDREPSTTQRQGNR